jgi:hypothetical protein
MGITGAWAWSKPEGGLEPSSAEPGSAGRPCYRLADVDKLLESHRVARPFRGTEQSSEANVTIGTLVALAIAHRVALRDLFE